MSSNCLNCDTPVLQNYCPNCGQKSTTHRYSIKHFIEHDFIHGVWHVDKGIFFTLKELFTNPGHSIRRFIEGKRVNYFSFVTLILLILTITTLLLPYTHLKMADLVNEESRAVMNAVDEFMTAYPKLALIISIPIYSMFSMLWFRKARLNLSEHLVMNSYRTIPELIVSLLISVISIFYTDISVLAILYIGVVGTFGFVYSVWFYYQFFSAYQYSTRSLIIRSILVPVSYILLSFLVGIVIAIVGTIL
jgi:hypothetical protein